MYQCAVARQQLRGMGQRNGRNFLVKHSAADQRVIPVRQAGLAHGFAFCRKPAKPQPGKRKCFGHAANRDALVVQIYNGFHPLATLGQRAVDFVTQQVGPAALCNGDNALQDVSAHQRAAGVIGVVDADQLRTRADQLFQLVKVGLKAVFLFQAQQLYRGTNRLGDRV